MNNKKFIVTISALFALNIVIILALTGVFTSSAATLRQGSTGELVKTVQTKLKNWGYYTGSVDGIYGSQTVEAVKRFQKTNGLTADGVCGDKTFAALGISVTGQGGSSASSNRENETALLARMITAEARGEPYLGQVAVGAVILNRIEHPSFPNTMSGVLFQPGAFSPVADGAFYSVTITDSARKAAQDCMNGWDPTGGAIYFYNPVTSTSKWIYSRPIVLTIGKHVFAK